MLDIFEPGGGELLGFRVRVPHTGSVTYRREGEFLWLGFQPAVRVDPSSRLLDAMVDGYIERARVHLASRSATVYGEARLPAGVTRSFERVVQL